jgi:hypothetical protein
MKTEQTLSEKVALKAAEFIEHFEKISVDRDGQKEEIYTLRNNAPSELKNLFAKPTVIFYRMIFVTKRFSIHSTPWRNVRKILRRQRSKLIFITAIF